MSDDVKLEPKSPRMIFAMMAVLLLVGLALAIYLMVRPAGTSTPASSTSDKVKIEVRAMPTMMIQKDGKKLGGTPLTFMVTKSITPITLQAEWVEQRFYANGEKKVPRSATKIVVPDHDQTIDFKRTDH